MQFSFIKKLYKNGSLKIDFDLREIIGLSGY